MSEPVAYSQHINFEQSEILFKLALEEARNNLMLKNLSQQRDDLLIKFVKSQKLAHLLLRDNNVKSKGKAFTRWKRLLVQCRKIDGSYALHSFIETVSQLKQKSEKLKNENLRLIDENKDLSTFNMESIDVAINLQNLNVEREGMKKHLAEQDDQVEVLLHRQM